MLVQPEATTVTWSTPECPFSIECSSRVLDDIRLSVNDAFFSLPRGGAEIGGILLGGWQEGRLTITDCAALDCEHALGPSFTLSLKDETRLQELIAAATGAGRVTVGWYHSHTRTGVMLSDTDLTIHNRFFPETWQVALVVKPHTLEPMRGGFFFRGHGGIIHSSASYREFPIDSQPLRQVPRPVPVETAEQPASRPEPVGGAIVDVRAEPEAAAAPVAPVVDIQAEPEEPPAVPIIDIRPEPEPQPEPAAAYEAAPEAAPPGEPLAPAAAPIPASFERRPEPTPRWLKVLVAVGVAVGAGGAGGVLYAVRDVWYPAVTALLHGPPGKAAAVPIGLNTVDAAGQLQIRWNPNAGAVRSATGASLEIVDGDAPRNAVRVEARQLASGVLTYQRRNERVDVTLALDEPGGTEVRQATSFLGPKPPAAVAAGASPINRDREETLRLAADLRAQLDAERERSRRLEKDLAAARAQLREQQLRRLGKQAAPGGQ
jgi:proteasome lid subunit RPN8/RPN11